MKHLFSHQQWQTGQLWSPTMVTLPGWSQHGTCIICFLCFDSWAIKKDVENGRVRVDLPKMQMTFSNLQKALSVPA